MTKTYSSVYEMGEEFFQKQLDMYKKFNDRVPMPEDMQREARNALVVRGMLKEEAVK